jgi:probable DNA repair protein
MHNIMTRNPVDIWQDTLSRLKDGQLLITASNRQRDYLHQVYRTAQPGNVWYRANILTFNDWLKQILETIQMSANIQTPSLLSKAQALYLWEQVIRAADDPLLNIPLAASKAYRAAEILHHWQATDSLDSELQFNERVETREFREWYQEIKATCLDKNLMPPYELLEFILAHLDQVNWTGSQKHSEILTLGFQQPEPIQVSLFNAFSSHGFQFRDVSPQVQPADVGRLEFKDQASELKHCALWAKQHYDADPTARLAIIIPELAQHRDLVRRYFSKVFQVNYWLDPQHQPEQIVDISLGLALNEYPLVSDLLMLLRLVEGRLAQHELIHLVQSHYLVGNNKNPGLLIRMIKQQRRMDYNRAQIQNLLIDNIEPDAQEGIAYFADIIASLDTFRDRRCHASEWVRHLSDFIQSVQYADESMLKSHEYQTREALFKQLENLATFDLITHEMSWFDWFDLFKRQLANSLFQPQTPDCPVQVMGLFEALSIQFDAIRMVGVDNNLWPARTNPNPYLPFGLQKQLEMPNANPARELQLCQQQFASLQQQCSSLLMSHVNDTGDEGHKVSPLLERVRIVDSRVPGSVDWLQETIQVNRADILAEPIPDNQVSAITDDHVKGGAHVLKAVAECPFSAFVHYRLRTQDPKEPKRDMDTMDKGNLLHGLLETLWRDAFQHDHVQLLAQMQQPGFEELLSGYVTSALETFNLDHNRRYRHKSLQLEHKRLVRLLKEWFELEAGRQPFKVIEQEQKHQVTLAGKTIDIYIDRVDQLADGSHLVLDYKSGQISVKDWFGERPRAPQLPLYACVLDEQQKTVSALAYGEVKFQESKFTGVSDSSETNPVLRNSVEKNKYTEAASLDEQIPIWREELASLMARYARGDSAVAPKDESSCQFCDLAGICRIKEVRERDSLEASS